jgi:hypothetical protein
MQCLQYWQRMLLLAWTCVIQTKNNNYFFSKQPKEKAKEEKKDMQV